MPRPPIPPQTPIARPPVAAARGRSSSSPVLKFVAGLSVVGMATTFAAVVWLAYVEGGSSARGEPPLIKAIPDPIKVAADADLEPADGASVDDLLSADPTTGGEGTLGAQPEEPILPEPEPEQARAGAAAEADAPEDDELAALSSSYARFAETTEAPPESAAAESTPGQGGPPDERSGQGQDAASGAGTRQADATGASAPGAAQPAANAQAGDASGAGQAAPALRPAPPPSRPTPPESTTVATATPTQQPPASRQRPSPLARQPQELPAQEPARESIPRISPSGIEQAEPAPSGQDRDRLRLEPPPPVLARAPAREPTPGGTPDVVTAPGDEGRAASQPVYRIQLASVRDEADARRAWDLYKLDLGEVLAGLPPVIERADIANGTFYRVQAGAFADRLEAEGVCDQLKQRNTACLVVRR